MSLCHCDAASGVGCHRLTHSPYHAVNADLLDSRDDAGCFRPHNRRYLGGRSHLIHGDERDFAPEPEPEPEPEPALVLPLVAAASAAADCLSAKY